MTTGTATAPGANLTVNFVPGQKIVNRYHLTRILGQGGMGVVWLARDEDLERDIALKFLPRLDRAGLKDLKNETSRSLLLTHPNIVRTYDFVQEGEIAGITMEYIDSDTLRNRQSDQPHGIFEPSELGEWITQLCNALDYAHHHAEVVHCDLKPANLLINGRNDVKVADFGISRSIFESVTRFSGTPVASGTLVYMSPQQLAGEPAHPTDDIYAVGATIYELCTKKPPFFAGVIETQVNTKVPPTMAKRRSELKLPAGEIPENWETTVAACLAKDPTQRPQSAGEIAVRLGLKSAPDNTASHPTFPWSVSTSSREVVRVSGTSETSSEASPPANGTGFVPSAGFVRPRITPTMIVAGVAALLGIVILTAWAMLSRAPAAKLGTAVVENGRNLARPLPTPQRSSQSDTVQPIPTHEQIVQKGSVFIVPQFPDARIKLDNQPAERAPTSLKDVPYGQHQLTVLRETYENATIDLNVDKEQVVADLSKVDFVRKTGFLSVTNIPADADVAIAGPDNLQKPTHVNGPWDSGRLPIGEYSVSVTRPGWHPITKKVTLELDELRTVPFNLTGATLKITSALPQATVLINSKPEPLPYTGLDLEPSDVEYIVSKAGYVSATVKGTLESGKVLALDAKLSKVTSAKPPEPHPRPPYRPTPQPPSNVPPWWVPLIPRPH